MIILLCTLLAIALTITVAGLLLSLKTSLSDQREVSYMVRDGGVRRVSIDRQRRIRRSVTTAERRSWSGVFPSVNIGALFGVRAGMQTPWLGILLILLALFGFSFYSLKSLVLDTGVLVPPTWPDAAVSSSPVASNPAALQMFPETSGASKALVRVSQLDPGQYSSQQEYDKWAYSACSAASMTEVINSYGNHYRVTDILNVESRIGEITPELGLLEPVGIDRTVAQFGYKAIWLTKYSLDDIINVANKGTPVIVGFPPARWSGGHILVLRGGNAQNVYLADSSRLNMQVMTRPTFLKYWAGFAVGVVPK